MQLAVGVNLKAEKHQWDASTTLEHVCQRLDGDLNSREQASIIARVFYSEAARLFNRCAIQLPTLTETPTGEWVNDDFIAVPFVTLDDEGEVLYFRLRFGIVGSKMQDSTWRYAMKQPNVEEAWKGPYGSKMFLWQSRPECPPPNAERSFSLPTLLSDFQRLYAATATQSDFCRDRIGGPIDVVAIDRQGVKWLQRK